VPASASSRTRSPSRTLAKGPPANASGQTWMAAGTLPEARSCARRSPGPRAGRAPAAPPAAA
jgi:hypothetical protein